MKAPFFILLLCGFLLVACMPSSGQTTGQDQTQATGTSADQTGTTTDQDDTGEPKPPPGSTLITSDELHSDQVAHVSVFTGDVVVIGTNFRMTCEEMTVNFTKDNKVDTIVATGNVVINQPDRVTTCGRADYFHDEDKFILTDQPVIHDHDNVVSGPKIVIYRTSQKMDVIGHSQTILGSSTMKSSSSDSSTNAPSPGTLPQQ